MMSSLNPAGRTIFRFHFSPLVLIKLLEALIKVLLLNRRGGTVLVKDLTPRMQVDEIELKIVEKGEPKDFQTRYGSSGKVCNAIGEDTDGGRIQVTLWNEDIDRVPEACRIRIEKGYVKEWNGELQISSGKYGKLEVLSDQ